mmetsp:Transcript_14926/g.26834  ORF Transcript_14926/g.26834 Transcript_14926/m.26834 type:complete len:191 (+) Transcript_14926:950-1522(+)
MSNLRMSEAELTELEEADYEKALLEMQANYEMKFQANQENSIQLQKDSAARFQSTMVQLGSSSKNFFTKKKTFSSKKKPAPKEHLVPDIVPQRLPFESPNVAATPNCDAKPRRAKTQREVTQAQKTRMVHDAVSVQQMSILLYLIFSKSHCICLSLLPSLLRMFMIFFRQRRKNRTFLWWWMRKKRMRKK